MIYDFREQLKQGQSGESQLDKYFSEWYDITPATAAQQRHGIDRIFRRKDNGITYKVEYKADTKASRTGNAFVETVSVDTADKPGWAYSSEADYLIYFLPDDLLIYVLTFESIRAHLPRWAKHHRTRRIPNDGYHTVGLLVPLGEFERGEYGCETWVYIFQGQGPTLESALDALRERVKCHYERIIDCGDGCYGRGEDVPHGIPQEKICQAPDTGCLADGSGDAI